MTKEKKMLEGWKGIASFLGVNERTAMRWHKNKNLPVYQTGKGKKVYAFEEEILEWIENNKRTKREKKKNNETIKKVVIAFLILFSIFYFSKENMSMQKPEKRITLWNLNKYGNKFKLDLLNKKGKIIKTLFISTSLKLDQKETPRWFDIGDINGDGAEDFVYFAPDNKISRLKIFLRKGDTFTLHKEVTFQEKEIFEGKQITLNHIHLVRLIDLDNDGKKEIAVSLSNLFLYPTKLVIYKENLKKTLLKVSHPGWFRSILAKDLNNDGKKELYIAGTNNFLGRERSEAIGIAIEGNWEKEGEIKFQNLKERKMAQIISPQYKAVYIRFGYNPDITHFTVWQFSRLQSLSIEENTLPYECDLILTNKLQNKPDYFETINLRCFILSYMFQKTISLFWNSAYFERLDIHINKENLKNLMQIKYFNGKTWQPDFCYYPVKK